MTIEKNPEAEGYVGSCDYCSHVEELEEAPSFFEALDTLKEVGWQVHRIGMIWKHECPDCASRRK